jgi:hypothetical protein
METIRRIEESLMPQKTCVAKDEMNLAEFPLCALPHRLPANVKTLQFEDRHHDKGRDKWITRRLIVSGCDAYGLPTEWDDEVLLGLIQLTRQQHFTDRKVTFTRYELIRLLGWRDDTRCYRRLEASLNRWMGVTLFYNNAWWNKARQCWMDAKFHVLDNVWLCHRAEPAPDIGPTGEGAPKSAFVWNEVIFRSFQAGNLKSIDLQFFTSLTSAVAKRLFRFLDKRFYHAQRFEIDLHELCFEKIGLSRNYDTANLKRKLLKGIKELEYRGFLEPVHSDQRFKKVRSKLWDVLFIQAEKNKSTSRRGLTPTSVDSLSAALIERGVIPRVAGDLVRGYPADHIREQLQLFDSMIHRGHSNLWNPPGFLVHAIQSEEDPPKDFINRNEALNRQRLVEQRVEARTSTLQAENQARDEQIERFWSSLPEAGRQQLESEALAQATNFQRELLKGDGPLALATKQSLINACALKTLRESKTSR